MQATVTLSTTTLAAPIVDSNQRHITLASLTGVSPGIFLYADKELMTVETLTPVSNVVVVRRGIDGTASMPHPNGATVTIGRGDQFYVADPVGAPPNPIPVYPYINVVTGVSWGVTGDDTGPMAAARIWSPIVVTPGIGALGVRTTTTTIPS